MPASTIVSRLQSDLTKLGYKPGPTDGWRGAMTIKATKAFQRDNGLVADGIAGPMTLAALRAALTPASKSAKAEPIKQAINAPLAPAPVAAPVKPSARFAIEIPLTSRRIVEIDFHCTATPEGRDYTVSDVRSWHKQRGWTDIGYHFIVYRDGTIHAGRPIGQVGAHIAGHNTGTIGVSYIGGLTADGKAAKDTRTPEQRQAMLWLAAELSAMFPIVRIAGHNEFAAKACPSFDVRNDQLGSITGFKRGRRAE